MIYCDACCQVLMQSELLRKEGNEIGPHKELEYWKIRSSVIDSIIDQLKLHSVRPGGVFVGFSYSHCNTFLPGDLGLLI